MISCGGGTLAIPADASSSTFDAARVATVHTSISGQKPVWQPSLTGVGGARLDLPENAGILLEWREPRDIRRIILRGTSLPDARDIEIQYWYRIWPDGGSGGWQRLDDPFNGEFVTVKAEAHASPGALVWQFAPLDKEENPKVERTGFDFRHTYKIRILLKAPATLDVVEAHTDSVWRSARIRMEWKASQGGQIWRGETLGRNARINSVEFSDSAVIVAVDYADNPDRLSEDRGSIAFLGEGWDGFSVFVDDVAREGAIYVRDIDAFVTDAASDLTYSQWGGPEGEWEATVMERVRGLPEQSLEAVMQAIPAKPPAEAHLGVANLRQEFTVLPDGNFELLHNSLRGPGRDADRRPWTEKALSYRWSLNAEGERHPERWLEENTLPIIHTRWASGDIQLHQQCFATTLMEPIGHNEADRRGDETLALLDRIDLTNSGSDDQDVSLLLTIEPHRDLFLEAEGILALRQASDANEHAGLTPVRGRFDVNGLGALCLDETQPQALRYSVRLRPGESHTVYFFATYIELLEDRELDALRHQSFEDRKAECIAYWKARFARGMQYDVPEPLLNDLWKANLWHVDITTDKDPVTLLHEHGAATVRYAVFPNETAMVAQSLEMRGLHEDAFRLLEPMLVCQSVKALPGNFISKEGLMYGCHPDAENDPYTAQGYNMHHGWAQWKLAEHYLYTRDQSYLERIAPSLVAASDWVTRERKATMISNPDGSRPLEYGLAPAGDLEDVEEYLYWYATNAYYYAGMKVTADVLAEIGHPEAPRLAREAQEFSSDLLSSVQRATALSPVVTLKDGAWIPYVTPRAYAFTHQKEGWIREGLYPSIHLLDADLTSPHSRPVTWILEELEDNIFLSAECGYNVQDQDRHFFCFGGFNLQPNLCPNAMAHLRRDEIPHFLRVFYNTCWASLYLDTMCFAEWVPHFGRGGGPLYKTPDECKFVQFMRNMLILEEGVELRLAAGVPRKWMEHGKTITITSAATFFGPMDLRIVSEADIGRIAAHVKLPERNRPESVWLRLRHPLGRPMCAVTINGETWEDFDAGKERIHLPPNRAELTVTASFGQ